MNFLENTYAVVDGRIRFSREQASHFAKDIAGDFNPLHNPDNKMFCVPGDLLFSVALSKYGLSQQMCITFSGMVSDGIPLLFPDSDAGQLSISDDDGKEYMSIERSGELTTNADLISSLTRRYVEFSGQTFPHILVPLMERHDVMINPSRPLVIYESMSISLERLDIADPTLELTDSTLEIKGKKGHARLEFCLKAANKIVGKGAKHMALRGLQSFDADKVNLLIEKYTAHKSAYSGR